MCRPSPQASVDPVQEVDSDAFSGRSAYLREQCRYHGVHVLAVQESRSHSTETIQSHSHIRLCSGRDAHGHHGIELWFDKQLPVNPADGEAIRFQLSDLLVLAADPRTLIVRLSRRGLHILFVAIHAPIATSTARETWWSELAVRVTRFRKGCQVVVLGDYNAHFGEPIPHRVGDLVWPSQGCLPAGLLTLLSQQDLWLPSTHTCCHVGPSETWITPNGLHGTRIDFIAVPTDWSVGPGASQVHHDLDWGQAHVDHYPVRLDVSFTVRFVQSSRSNAAVDRDAMATVEGQAVLRRIWDTSPLPPWSMNVHRHWDIVEQHVSKSILHAFPARRGSCRASHFSTGTWLIRQKRVWLRRQLLRLRQQLSMTSAQFAWRVWTRDLRPFVCRIACAVRAAWAGTTLQTVVGDLRRTKQGLRTAVRHDQRLHVEKAALAASRCPVAITVSALRPLLGPPKRRCRARQGLPLVLNSDGEPAQTQEEAEQMWIRHFSGLEAGQIVDPTEFAARCLQRQLNRDLDALCIARSEFPSRCELEQAIRSTQTGRAAGVDGLPRQILHHAAAASSRPLFQLALKLGMRISEPLHFKGGALHTVWKGKPRVEAHRGILVSSCVGKSLHRAVRCRAVGPFASSASPLQLGGLPRCPVTTAAHAVRLFQHGTQRRNESCALIFLDLREAFYRVVRPLITGSRFNDEDYAKVAATLRLAPDTLAVLHRHLQESSLPHLAGASGWNAMSISELLECTWFRFRSGDKVVETGIGSRPGDNVADLVFSYLFACVLSDLKAHLHDAGILTCLPWDAAFQGEVQPISTPSSADTALPVMDVTWMDDLSLMVRTSRAVDLPGVTSRAAAALIDQCLDRGLVPNLDKSKTEIIMSPVGAGSRQVRATAFRDKDPALQVASGFLGAVPVRLVSQYRHLGGIVHHSGRVLKEVRHRIALAHEAFQKHRRRIFAAPGISLSAKVTLYHSLVAPVLLHGAGTWIAIEASAESALSHAHTLMAAKMLRPHFSFEEGLRLGPGRILAHVGLPSISVLLHVARLRQLLPCVGLAIREVWALAHWEETWLASVRSSLAWLQELVNPHCASWAVLWPDWRTMMTQHPGRWKALLRRAQAAACRREAWDAARPQDFCRANSRVLGAPFMGRPWMRPISIMAAPFANKSSRTIINGLFTRLRNMAGS